MTRHLAAACGAFALAGLTLSAQTSQAPGQPPGTRTPGESNRAAVMTGCLTVWDGSTGAVGSKPGTPDEVDTPTQFVLTDATEGGENMTPQPPDTAADAPASPAPHPSLAHSTLIVEAKDNSVDLKAHLDRRVQLTGVLTSPVEDAPAPGVVPGAPGVPGAPETRVENAIRQVTFVVTALEVIAPSCDR